MPSNAHGILPLFGESDRIDYHYAIWGAYILTDQMMGDVAHLDLVPDVITDEPLHAPHVTPFHLEGYGLDRFAFQGTELPDQIAKKVRAGLTPCEALAEGFMKASQFMQKAVNITVCQYKFWRR